MFDAEKLLGGLLGSGLGRHGLGSILGNSESGNNGMLGKLANPGTQSVAMGLLGVAMAAFEHFGENRGQGAPTAPGTTPGHPPRPASAPPPPPPGAAAPTAPVPGAPPPAPPRGSATGTPPPPPPGATPAPADPQAEALLYVRAMIAAAAADGTIDEQERSRILGQLESTGLDDQERDFLLQEMAHPAAIEQLAAGVRDPHQALQLYVCSLLAVEVDTTAERDHLRRLAQALQLAPETLEELHARYQVTM